MTINTINTQVIDRVNEISSQFTEYQEFQEKRLSALESKGGKKGDDDDSSDSNSNPAPLAPPIYPLPRAEKRRFEKSSDINSGMAEQIKSQQKQIDKLRAVLLRPELEFKSAGNTNFTFDSNSDYSDSSVESRARDSKSRTNSPFYAAKSWEENQEYSQKFSKYLRQGSDYNLKEFEEKSLTKTVDSSGYVITSRMADIMEDRLIDACYMRSLAKVDNISTDALELIDDNSDMFCGWSAEEKDYKKYNNVTLRKQIIPVFELFAQPKITQKQADDQRMDIENIIANKLVDIFKAKENQAFLRGDGIGKPKGILSYATDGEVAFEAKHKDFSADMIMELFYALPEEYAINAKFLMSRKTLQKIRTLRETQSGKYLWQPNFEGKGPDTLLGREVIECADMPDIAQGSSPIIVADFKRAYQIVDRGEVRVLRDPYSDKPNISYFATKQVGGDIINKNAIRILNLA